MGLAECCDDFARDAVRLTASNIGDFARGLPAKARLVLHAALSLPKGSLAVKMPDGRAFRIVGRQKALRLLTTATMLSAEEALAYLLSDPVEHERRRQELRNAFSDTICHQIATINGMVAGARALLDELEPAAIARGSEQGLLSGHRASWKVFVERWERLATRDGPLLAALFGPEFARVYTEVGEELRAGWKRALGEQSHGSEGDVQDR